VKEAIAEGKKKIKIDGVKYKMKDLLEHQGD